MAGIDDGGARRSFDRRGHRGGGRGGSLLLEAALALHQPGAAGTGTLTPAQRAHRGGRSCRGGRDGCRLRCGDGYGCRSRNNRAGRSRAARAVARTVIR